MAFFYYIEIVCGRTVWIECFFYETRLQKLNCSGFMSIRFNEKWKFMHFYSSILLFYCFISFFFHLVCFALKPIQWVLLACVFERKPNWECVYARFEFFGRKSKRVTNKWWFYFFCIFSVFFPFWLFRFSERKYR